MGCDILKASKNQPSVVEIFTSDGVSSMQIQVPDAGSLIPQHSHEYEHITLLAQGKIRAWKDGKYLGEFKAPAHLVIPANSKHTFETLVDDVLLYCIHNVERTGKIDVKEEHQIVGKKLCLSE